MPSKDIDPTHNLGTTNDIITQLFLVTDTDMVIKQRNVVVSMPCVSTAEAKARGTRREASEVTRALL